MRGLWRCGAAFFVLSMGCVLPRSMVFGQTAAALGAGQSEVGASIGPQFTQFTDNGTAGTSTTPNPNLFAFPVTEANYQYGATNTVGVNLHVSPAGIQPGLKFTLLDGPIKLALLPEIGGGIELEGGAGASTDFVFLAGLKAIVSSAGGFYFGLGYDFTYLSENINSSSLPGSTSSGSTTPTPTVSATSHSVALGLGYEVKAGGVRVRPELAMLYSPGFQSSGATAIGQVVFFPNVTVSLGTSGSSASSSGARDDDSTPSDRPAPMPFKF
jgi:hypothetical protein